MQTEVFCKTAPPHMMIKDGACGGSLSNWSWGTHVLQAMQPLLEQAQRLVRPLWSGPIWWTGTTASQSLQGTASGTLHSPRRRRSW